MNRTVLSSYSDSLRGCYYIWLSLEVSEVSMLVDVINWANYVINHIIIGDHAKKLRACLHEVGQLLGGGGGWVK